MKDSFKELGIVPPILQALEEMGFEEPTQVQAEAIPHILNGEDVIVMSKTGSGKTAVFGVSMLQRIDPEAPGPQALILTPTRELAVQIDGDLKQMAKHMPHKTVAVYGQHNINTEITALKAGPAIVTGTPGRVNDHIKHGALITKNIRFLVLDEADRMLDMGFIDQVRRIIRTLSRDRVTLLFSATIPPEVERICKEQMKNPLSIKIESPTMTVDTIDQVYYRVARDEKRTVLDRILTVEQPESCIIFCNTRHAVDSVQNFLMRKGYASHALHGEIPQGQRMKTIGRFKEGKFPLLIATDVAARGIHIEHLSLVINYDVPNEKDSYVHRIGRTGRAGNVGRSITMVTGNDILDLYAIEEHIGTTIDEGTPPTDEAVNEKKATAEVWRREQMQKDDSPARNDQKSTGGSSFNDRPRQGGSRGHGGRPRPQGGQHRDSQSRSGQSGPKPQHRQGSQPSGQPRPAGAKPQSQGQPKPQNQPRPQHNPRPAAPNPITPKPQPVKPQAVKPVETEKKSLWGRLFGRKKG